MKLTLANKLTFTRFCLVPVFITLVIFSRNWNNESQYIPLAIFISAAMLDVIDGYVARTYNQITHLGTILDPLADKFLTISALTVLILRDAGEFFGMIPNWVLLIVFIREFILIFGAAMIFIITRKISVKPRISGKFSSLLLAIVIALALAGAHHKLIFWTSLPAVFFTIYAGIRYMIDGVMQLRSYYTRPN